MTVVGAPLSWLPQLLHSLRGFNQSGSVKGLRHESHHHKVHIFFSPSTKGAKNTRLAWRHLNYRHVTGKMNSTPRLCSVACRWASGAAEMLYSSPDWPPSAVEEGACHGWYTVPARPLRTTRMSSSILTGSRTHARAAGGNLGIVILNYTSLLGDTLKLNTRAGAWWSGEVPDLWQTRDQARNVSVYCYLSSWNL